MKNITAVLLLVAATAQAQIVIEQRTIEVPRDQNFIIMPSNGCATMHSRWDAKRYGAQYRCLEDVPAHIRVRVDNPPLRSTVRSTTSGNPNRIQYQSTARTDSRTAQANGSNESIN